MIIVIIAILFVLSIFFSVSETALTSLNPVKLQTQAKNEDKKAQKLLRIIENPSELYIVNVIGNNIVDLSIVSLVVYWTLDTNFNTILAVTITILTIIIFAEIIPITIARAIPQEIASAVCPIIQGVIKILKPIIWLLGKMSLLITNRFHKEGMEEVSVSKDELRTLVELAGLEGTFRADESYRIKGVLDFYNLNVRDVMKTPRVDIVALPISSTYEEVRDFAIDNRFTRFPVYDEDIDNIVGIMHTKYLLSWSVNPKRKLEEFIDSDPLVVYEFQPIEEIFRKMTKERRHLAIVLDEYGGTEGIITHEDIIEGMIGLEIHDEMDEESEVLIEKLTPTKVICDGKVTLHRLNTIFQTEIPEEEDVLAAYLLSEFKDFPKTGDTLERDNLTFKILTVEDRTIRKVQIVK
ncbi:hemolysin family protein [Oceanobacillus alkalisoli]|uniref:hemolysin family protein n=1 Tax=Oceanobacillus alkalisoli TaxID=2925113 RepID=UPI001F11C103|nr:hemolysin family protein [Oceanobacillus alkalisoli]MCF3943975.1 hemolysin family protein [Oceanobacillus alkalisoli]